MHLKLVAILLCSLFCQSIKAQNTRDCIHCTPGGEVYHLDWAKDGLIMGVGLSLSAAGLILRNNADAPTEFDILNLDRNNIGSFDRGATNNYSTSSENISDVILFSSLAVPFVTYITKEIRHEGLNIGIMAVETFLINTGITNILKGTTKRYRPFAYNSDLTLEEKLTANSRLSFISGHVSNVTAMSFFSAKVITDLHPEIKNKGIIWASAAALPALVGYFRYKAGKHFPTDVIGGYVVGASIGYLVPKIHLSDNSYMGIGYDRSLKITLLLK